MPISREVLMKCKYCGFKTYRIIGDLLPDKNQLKPCPKCKKPFSMQIVENNGSLTDSIVGRVGSLIDKIK